MSMLRIKVSADITSDVIVTWSPEYGATVLGPAEFVNVEEIPAKNPNMVEVPWLDAPPMKDTPRKPVLVVPTTPEPESDIHECLVCGCKYPHGPGECPHQCLNYVEA